MLACMCAVLCTDSLLCSFSFHFQQVFHGGASKPTFFVANRGHHADIGGITPGKSIAGLPLSKKKRKRTEWTGSLGSNLMGCGNFSA